MTRIGMASSSIVPCMILLVVLSVITTPASAYDWDCNLFCYNHGTCVHGRGQFGSYIQVLDEATEQAEEEQELDLFAEEDAHKKHIDGMYCQCPMGYTGLQCEIKLSDCPQSHKCSNGHDCRRGKVNKKDGRTFFHCECDVEETDFTLHEKDVAKYCDHISRIFCGVSKNAQSSIGGSESYCMNGGRCLGKNSEGANLNSPVGHYGCHCPEAYYGDHCEHMEDDFKYKTTYGSVTVTDSQKKKAMRIVAWVVGVTVGVILLAIFIRDRRKYVKKKKAKKAYRSARPNFPPPMTTGSAAHLKGSATYA
eukprot:CAMPEP_0119551604 /NCGR_PEP_ID=MMETSP1352-20130426/4808_1 /TAXON_ID=265584 /ORGANISM="Stauroneis constricta, Strain CCMP1120" /LENGTH=306 /DNA_ID=CAMNT_0007597689 /DNA_START=279 /DNA_END=1199 /DNA_ORIENTATION=-